MECHRSEWARFQHGVRRVLQVLTDRQEEIRLRRKLVYLAWRRYGIAASDADDIVQNACVAYLEVKDRYGKDENHHGILIGIFRNKCREFLEARRRGQQRLDRYRQAKEQEASTTAAGPPDEEHGALADLMQDEDNKGIRAAITELRPEAREMLLLLVSVGRQGLLDRYDLKPNTLDSRLHVYRRELRKLLRKKGIRI